MPHRPSPRSFRQVPILGLGLVLVAAMGAGPVLAQDWMTRTGDVMLTKPELDARLRGQRATFFDDGQAHFYNDGRYTYAYDLGQGGYAYGYFDVAEDSMICVTFLNGAARCDRFVENGGRLVVLTEAGDRFPIRVLEDAGPDPVME